MNWNKLLKELQNARQEREASVNSFLKQTPIELDIMSKLFADATMVQMCGLPLMGKSYLAHKIAFDMARQVQQFLGVTLHVHTISLRGNVGCLLDLRKTVLSSLNCLDMDVAMNARHFWQYIECIQGMHLFIFDNAEVLTEDLQDDFFNLCTYLCTASDKVRLFITGRRRYRLERETTTFQTVEVLPLSLEDSRIIFRSIVGDLGLWEHQLVPLCGGIPHALLVVARALRDKVYTPGEMLSILSSIGLSSFSTHFDQSINLQSEFEKSLRTLTDKYLKRRCAELVYIPGTFSPEAAAYIIGLPMSAAKHDVIEPLHSVSLILRKGQQDERFQIQTFIRSLVEDHFGIFRNESLIRNRYCRFFAQLLQRLTPLADRSRSGTKFHLITQELTNLEKLLQDAVHLIDEQYDLFFDIAYNAEYHIINLMPKKESVDFYEALMNTAKLRDRRQYGILLSSFGQVSIFDICSSCCAPGTLSCITALPTCIRIRVMVIRMETTLYILCTQVSIMTVRKSYAFFLTQSNTVRIEQLFYQFNQNDQYVNILVMIDIHILYSITHVQNNVTDM